MKSKKNAVIEKKTPKRPDRYYLYAIPLLLLCILLTLSIIDGMVKRQIALLEVSPVHYVTVSDYPYLVTTNPPAITAYAGIIMDDSSKRILYAKSPTFRFSMASTTKIMTSLAGLDYFHPDSVLTVKRSGVEGTVVGFKPGEKYYFADVLYGMLLPSGNDAAFTVADNYPGGVQAFVSAMNEKAASLHLKNTHYSDPAGLNDDGDYTTVVDLAYLASVVLHNKTISQVVDTRERAFSSVDGKESFDVVNLNKLLDIPGVTGIKTGHTEGAGDVLITSKIENGHTLIFIVMNSEDRFADTEVLLHYIDGNISYFTPQKM